MDRQKESEGDADFLGSKGVIRKNEFVRVIADALYALGCPETGKQLEEESGISLHSSEVMLFKQQILDGQWDESVTTLHQIGLLDETIVKSASHVILERKFFEFLAGDNFMDALYTLRKQIQPLGVDDDKVRKLCTFLLFPSRELEHGTSGQESGLVTRKEFLEELKTLFPPSVLFAENRLVHLVEQGIDQENELCWFHNLPIGKMSLLSHQECKMDQIPNRTVQVLQGHNGEVWFLKFSHNGKYLASSSSDCLVIIWEVQTVDGLLSIKHRLYGHRKPVSYVTWSHDDNQLLTCGEEETVRRWDVASGECKHVYQINGAKPDLGLVSCEWAPDGKSIYSGVNDKRIIMWDPEGKEVQVLPGQRTMRIADLCITSDGKELITVCEESKIVLFNLTSNSVRYIEEDQPIVSCTLSEDNQSLLVSLLDERLKVWNIAGPTQTLADFTGYRRSRYVVRACFGGVKERFIAGGSEDSQVYIWHKKTTPPMSKLAGHTAVVNCVSWNPEDPHMLASGSDDHTIRIWGVTPEDTTKRAKSYFSKKQEPPRK